MNGKSKSRSVDGRELAEEIKAFVQRYVIMTEAQALVCTLWMIHTYLFPEYRGSTGYLHISSPVAECGKSQLLEISELFVANPLTIGGATAAALIRTIDKDAPCLLFDEADLNFHDKEMSALLCSVFNNGWRPNRPYIKCDGEKNEVRKFQVFGPKALAGIGTHYLQPATLTRCFPIKLQRHAPGRMAEEYYIDIGEAEAAPIKQKIVTWVSQRKPAWLENRRPTGIPGWLNSRRKSISFPLFAIGDDLGGKYPELLAEALQEIFIGEKAGKARLDYKLQLLSDIRQIFVEFKKDAIETGELLGLLCEIETSPWAEATAGKPLTPHRLSLLLRDFGPEPRQYWEDLKKKRGYKRDEFEIPWSRYLPPLPPVETVGSVDSATNAGKTHFPKTVGAPVPTDSKNEPSVNLYAAPTLPTDFKVGRMDGKGDKLEFRCNDCNARFDTSAGYAKHKAHSCA